MAKPTVLAPWATDANYPAGAEPEAGTPTKVAYTLGREAVGWRPGGKPSAQELNTWMHRVGLWIAYLNVGEWDDDLHVTGDATVDGSTTLSGDLDVGGTATLAPDKNIELQGEGRILTGERDAFVPLCAALAQIDPGGDVNSNFGTVGAIVTTGTTCRIPLLLNLDQFQTITGVVVVGNSVSGALLELEYGGTAFSSAGGFSGGGSGPFWNLSGTPFLNMAPLWLKVTNLGSNTVLNYAIVKYEARP